MFSCIFILCSPVFVSAVFVHLCLVFFRAYFETLVVEAGGERLESRDQVHLCVLCICIWCFHVFVSDVFVYLYQVFLSPNLYCRLWLWRLESHDQDSTHGSF